AELTIHTPRQRIDIVFDRRSRIVDRNRILECARDRGASRALHVYRDCPVLGHENVRSPLIEVDLESHGKRGASTTRGVSLGIVHGFDPRASDSVDLNPAPQEKTAVEEVPCFHDVSGATLKAIYPLP